MLLEALGEDDGDMRWAAARIVVRMRDEPGLVGMLVELAVRGRGSQRKMALYCIRDLEVVSTDTIVDALWEEAKRLPRVAAGAAPPGEPR